MTISAVIPTLNEENFIENCLKSLKFQTYPIDEIIVVDACSTDRTVDIALGYTEKVFIIEEENIGLQRQTGLELSKGDIIISCDADCVYPCHFVERIVGTLSNPENVAVYGSIFPLSSGLLSNYNCALRNGFLARPFLNRGCSFAFRKLPNASFGIGNRNEIIELKNSLAQYGKVVYDPELVVLTDIPMDQQLRTGMIFLIPLAYKFMRH